jgi:hypothetical protein
MAHNNGFSGAQISLVDRSSLQETGVFLGQRDQMIMIQNAQIMALMQLNHADLTQRGHVAANGFDRQLKIVTDIGLAHEWAPRRQIDLSLRA